MPFAPRSRLLFRPHHQPYLTRTSVLQTGSVGCKLSCDKRLPNQFHPALTKRWATVVPAANIITITAHPTKYRNLLCFSAITVLFLLTIIHRRCGDFTAASSSTLPSQRSLSSLICTSRSQDSYSWSTRGPTGCSSSRGSCASCTSPWTRSFSTARSKRRCFSSTTTTRRPRASAFVRTSPRDTERLVRRRS